MKTLILGTAFGYQIQDVWVFVESLRRHYDGGAIVLVSSQDVALVNYLNARQVIPVFFDAPRWMFCHVQVGRYIRYGELLRPSAGQHDRILLTDVSDVVFQAHPFADAPKGDLLCYAEHGPHLIGDDPTNSFWVEQMLGTHALNQVRDKPISCSGTTIGGHLAILQYIDRLLLLANPQVLDRNRDYRGHDQGLHNFLLHTGALPGAQLIPNGHHVLTMGAMPDNAFTLGPSGTILTLAGRACPIVHQYNYHPAALAHIRSLYPAPSAV